MEEKEKNENQEVTPEWAKKLTESMEKVVDSLSHLSPQENPQEDDPNRTIEIPVPQEPPKEEPEVIPTEEPAPQEETPKKRKFLDWLL